MIPVRLELTNFLSYRETAVLAFDGIHLAGISGANGAGKSSIMEAMTWALFGQSRVRSDDDVVNRRAGEDEAAEVRFEFKLEDVTYRVIRRKSRGKTMVLELQMEAEGGWKPLSESKIRETQAAVEQLLQMNYDTFTNASFLLQDKADQFTTRTPSQRKEILAELLGVTQWEQYRERAAGARKALEGETLLIEARLDEIAAELAQEEQRRSALEEAQAAHAILIEKRALKEQLLTESRLTEAARNQQRQAIGEMEARIRRLQAQMNQAQENLRQQRARRDALAATIDEAQQIEADFSHWQKADQQAQAFEDLSRQHHQLLQAMQPYEVAVAEARSRLQQELAALQTKQQQIDAAREERTALLERIETAVAQLAEMQEERVRLRQLQAELQEARGKLQQAEGERKLWRQELQGLRAQAERMDALVRERSEARGNRDEALAMIADLDESIAVIGEQQAVLNDLKAEMQALSAQQPALRQEMKELEKHIGELVQAAAGGVCPLCNQALSETHRETVLETLRNDGKQKGDSFRANDARIKALQVEMPQIEKTVQKGPPLERERQAQQKRLALAEARLEEIAKANEEWAAGGEKRFVGLAASLADESELKSLQEQVESLDSSLRDEAALQERVTALQDHMAAHKARLAEVERLLAEWQLKEQERLSEVDRLLKEEDFAAEARGELRILQEKLDQVAYDASAHQAALAERQAVASAPERHQALREARAALEPLQHAIDDLVQRSEQQEIDLEEQTGQLGAAREQLAALEEDAVDLKTLEQEVVRLGEEAIAASQRVGRAQQELDVLENLRDLGKNLREEKGALSLRVKRLAVLEKSCGRKGVQALLIEHALPEIEEGANILLDRLTGGEMRVRFDTQRQLKSRDALAETLDIIIADRAGERPYDNYSGGEQFRINFAIRLALSQLLANRAGARLQTLVVDEGFGSQDPQGRQRLIEAINAVQDDFACILVITHIDELREAFPVRIEVTKESGGSKIAVQ